MSRRKLFLDPLIDQNPVMVQILGVCSALAVTRELVPSLVMGLAVTCVLAYTNVAVSVLRHVMTRSIRLILEVVLIASAVIVIDEFLKAYSPGTSRVLSVFVGLIVTNCLVLGRAEAFAMHNPVLPSLIDGLGNGIGYGLVLAFVAASRELLGAGTMMGVPVLRTIETGGWFTPNQLMHKPVSAFLLIGLLIWLVRSLRPRLVSPIEAEPPWRRQEQGLR